MLNIANKFFKNRLLLGTSQYPTLQNLIDAIQLAKVEIITVSMGRQRYQHNAQNLFWDTIKTTNCSILPNTAGCRTAQEAIAMAEMSREVFQTNWIKLEVIGDEYSLQPDPFELLLAAKELIQHGFIVFPYCTEDLVLCQRLVDVGCEIVMPWAAPIGSGKGILNPYALETLRKRLPQTTIIIDAGIGKPSHAVQVMEFGVDAVLINTAVALANNPAQMAMAFSQAVAAGHEAYAAGLMPERNCAVSSTALIDTPFWIAEHE